MRAALILLLAALLSGGLVACQGDMAGGGSSDRVVQGYVVVPPLAGTAEFQSVVGEDAPVSLATANVNSDGRFQLVLPALPPNLPAAENGGNTALLPFAPSREAREYRAFTCPQTLSVSDRSARVALVKLGQFRVGRTLTGQLLPAVTGVSGGSSQEISVLTEQYAFADRDVTVAGTLPCLLTDPQGQTSPTTVRVDYALKRGWNRLTIQTFVGLADGSLNVVTRASTDLDGVQWRYLPMNP